MDKQYTIKLTQYELSLLFRCIVSVMNMRDCFDSKPDSTWEQLSKLKDKLAATRAEQ